MDNVNLEDNMKALEETIAKLERGDLSLNEAFDTYKKGMDLLVKCNEAVDRVEKELQHMEGEGI